MISIRDHRSALAAATFLIVLVGCGQRPESSSENQTAEPGESDSLPPTVVDEGPIVTGLAGTHWRLVEFQSMDDAIGTTRPEDPSVYTLAFNDDGTLAMELDCNRGTGPWSASPGQTGETGGLAIGPLAVTRAQCPPPSMGEQIARDMDFVRGYMLRDGRLSLSLMADGGIYVWEQYVSSEMQ